MDKTNKTIIQTCCFEE